MTSIFISHSSRDRSFLEQLVPDLRQNGHKVWYDGWEMLPGDSLTQKIGAAILNNDFFAVVLSPNSVGSEWVQRELGVALNREFKERRVRVIPILIKDCQIPAFLRDKVYADFRDDYREGPRQLLRALGSKTNAQIGTSLPTSKSILYWDNVIGDNLTTKNVIE